MIKDCTIIIFKTLPHVVVLEPFINTWQGTIVFDKRNNKDMQELNAIRCDLEKQRYKHSVIAPFLEIFSIYEVE